MSKKEKSAPLDEEKEQQAAPAGEAAPEVPQEQEETFTLTKEQMEKMEGLAEQLAAQNDKYLRLAAEYDNYRKRTAKEKESIYQDASFPKALHLPIGLFSGSRPLRRGREYTIINQERAFPRMSRISKFFRKAAGLLPGCPGRRISRQGGFCDEEKR